MKMNKGRSAKEEISEFQNEDIILSIVLTTKYKTLSSQIFSACFINVLSHGF